jgi:hypothetical protein
VASPAWRLHFTDFKVKNGDPEHSDHRPVVVSVVRSNRPVWTGNRGVNKRFEARWLMEEECETMVTNAWGLAAARGEVNIMGKLKTVSKELHSWSRDVLGDLQNRIKNLKVELEECRRGDITTKSVSKEQRVRFKLERLEDQWEMSWRQRAHAN